MGIRLILSIALLAINGDYGIKDGKSLIGAMLKKYEGKWYETLTFEQNTIRYDSTGQVSNEQLWYEAIQLPDKLIIKYEDLNKGNGILFRNDSLYRFQNGAITNARPMIHPLLVLGFSVYGQPAEKTIASLSALGFDFSKFHEREFEGRQVYVVGAMKGDSSSNQFWIDKKRLLFVRAIQNFGNDQIQDIRFNDYQKIGGGWVAKEVLFYSNGNLRLKEIYSNVRSPKLDKNLFIPSNFAKANW